MNNLHFNVISDLSPDGIVFINDLGMVDYVNPAFYAFTGYSTKDLIGIDEDALSSRIRDLCDADDDSETFDIRSIEDATILKLCRPAQRSFSCISRVTDDIADSAQGKILYFHDVTSKKEEDDSIKSEFLSVAAHQLRTPLVGILGFSELLLKKDFEPTRQKEAIATIFRQATNFKLMLDDFFDIIRLDVGKGSNFNIEKGTLEKLLKDIVADASHNSREVKITLEPPDIWPDVNFDTDKITRVFNNLVNNAMKYSHEGGRVLCSTVIRSDKSTSEFGVRISDEGVGIASTDLVHVGERFYRAAEPQSVPGSGLGIAIVKAIVAIHRGRFELTSTKDKGTTAIVWLPVILDSSLHGNDRIAGQ